MAPRQHVQRATLLAAILGSGVTMLDESAIFVAVPAIERDLGIGLAGQQWVVNGYLLTLSAFLLVGGALGDLLGRRRMLLIGAGMFGAASLAAALAPSGAFLIGARAVKGWAQRCLCRRAWHSSQPSTRMRKGRRPSGCGRRGAASPRPSARSPEGR